MKNLSLILLSILCFSCSQKENISIQSPDGKIQINLGIDETSAIFYSVDFEDSILIQKSQLGFQFPDKSNFAKNLKIVSYLETEVNQAWKPVYGERAEVKDIYNQVKIHLKETISSEREFEISFRVYNEGVAFNYTFLPQAKKESIVIQKELTEFKLNEDYNCWVSDRAQSGYRKVPISSISKPAERPLVIEAGKNVIALGEAKLVDFARMKFLAGGNKNSLVAELQGEAKVSLPYTTPWRTIMVGKSPGELLENNYFFENLNNPCAIKDVAWIKPGKIIREVTLTTQGGKACVDFAAENGLQYVEFDAGWYGPENNSESDATTITVDPKRSPGPLELLEVIKYGESKNIGIIVYVNRRSLEKQLDEILPLFKKWGIKGVKYGFVQVGDQKWTTWLHEAIKKAAENKLMVDIHDEYRPTGFSRTYPNLMTQEGIRGDEESPSNEHTLTTLFTRMLAGAGDNTNCYYAQRVNEKMGGNVSQLAKAVMIYSPWQFLYWYDRPEGSPGKTGGAGSAEGFIQNLPELDFYKNLPVVWNESKVLEGKISEYATLARKSGNDWFLGSLTGNHEKSIKINLDFLDADANYRAIIYSHDSGLVSSTKVKIEKQIVTSEKSLNYTISEKSGLAIHFEKL
ncbi:MAG: glycoside hydrolase family 97 N-terminal domain-containing protein [Bacteroidetes bacterium]|nr:glycoside hydrolase family 97 N-terminal domain-containing protein [Bacteroidota bacterium]